MSKFRVTCNGKTTVYPESERLATMIFYEDCIYASEGSEQTRYVSVFLGLLNRCEDVDDEWKWKFGELML